MLTSTFFISLNVIFLIYILPYLNEYLQSTIPIYISERRDASPGLLHDPDRLRRRHGPGCVPVGPRRILLGLQGVLSRTQADRGDLIPREEVQKGV